MNPTTEAVSVRVRKSIADLRDVARGLSAEALNWRPAPETNSIASQVAHVTLSGSFFLQAAAGTDRDLAGYLAVREEPFHSGADEQALLQMLDAFEREVEARLETVPAGSLGEVIDWSKWDRGLVTVAWCLLSVVEHVREHVGASMLTRQLWFEERGR